MPKNTAINLLPQEEFDVSLVGRALKWAMSTFRIIVVVTEMIVMGAFLSRFWLDAQNSDLNDSIKIKSAQILAQASTEKQFRNVQSQLNISAQLSQTSPSSQKIELITRDLPPSVTLAGISVLNGTIQIRGSSDSEFGIAQFVSNLKAEKIFKTVDLGQLNSSENNAALTVFSIKVTY